jgi:putative FmdB family regulatory protein
MPIYEYRCEKGHTFEVMQSIADDALTACEVCEAPVQKVLHAPAVHFKGSGFYTTDYGKGKKSSGGGEPKKDKGDSSGSSDGASPSSDSGTASSSSNGASSETAKAGAAKSD